MKGFCMLELILLVNLVVLILIYLQLRKNIKETDAYFSALDLSLRQFFANISNTEEANNNKRHGEILKQLSQMSKHSDAIETILHEIYKPKSIEELHEESKAQWLPNR